MDFASTSSNNNESRTTSTTSITRLLKFAIIGATTAFAAYKFYTTILAPKPKTVQLNPALLFSHANTGNQEDDDDHDENQERQSGVNNSNIVKKSNTSKQSSRIPTSFITTGFDIPGDLGSSSTTTMIASSGASQQQQQHGNTKQRRPDQIHILVFTESAEVANVIRSHFGYALQTYEIQPDAVFLEIRVDSSSNNSQSHQNNNNNIVNTFAGIPFGANDLTRWVVHGFFVCAVRRLEHRMNTIPEVVLREIAFRVSRVKCENVNSSENGAKPSAAVADDSAREADKQQQNCEQRSSGDNKVEISINSSSGDNTHANNTNTNSNDSNGKRLLGQPVSPPTSNVGRSPLFLPQRGGGGSGLLNLGARRESSLQSNEDLLLGFAAGAATASNVNNNSNSNNSSLTSSTNNAARLFNASTATAPPGVSGQHQQQQQRHSSSLPSNNSGSNLQAVSSFSGHQFHNSSNSHNNSNAALHQQDSTYSFELQRTPTPKLPRSRSMTTADNSAQISATVTPVLSGQHAPATAFSRVSSTPGISPATLPISSAYRSSGGAGLFPSSSAEQIALFAGAATVTSREPTPGNQYFLPPRQLPPVAPGTTPGRTQQHQHQQQVQMLQFPASVLHQDDDNDHQGQQEQQQQQQQDKIKSPPLPPPLSGGVFAGAAQSTRRIARLNLQREDALSVAAFRALTRPKPGFSNNSSAAAAASANQNDSFNSNNNNNLSVTSNGNNQNNSNNSLANQAVVTAAEALRTVPADIVLFDATRNIADNPLGIEAKSRDNDVVVPSVLVTGLLFLLDAQSSISDGVVSSLSVCQVLAQRIAASHGEDWLSIQNAVRGVDSTLATVRIRNLADIQLALESHVDVFAGLAVSNPDELNALVDHEDDRVLLPLMGCSFAAFCLVSAVFHKLVEIFGPLTDDAFRAALKTCDDKLRESACARLIRGFNRRRAATISLFDFVHYVSRVVARNTGHVTSAITARAILERERAATPSIPNTESNTQPNSPGDESPASSLGGSFAGVPNFVVNNNNNGNNNGGGSGIGVSNGILTPPRSITPQVRSRANSQSRARHNLALQQQHQQQAPDSPLRARATSVTPPPPLPPSTTSGSRRSETPQRHGAANNNNSNNGGAGGLGLSASSSLPQPFIVYNASFGLPSASVPLDVLLDSLQRCGDKSVVEALARTSLLKVLFIRHLDEWKCRNFWFDSLVDDVYD